MKKFNYVWACLLTLCLCSCDKNTKPGAQDAPDEPTYEYTKVTPVPFPVLDIAGFSFPEDPNKLIDWVEKEQNDSIYIHGWGIWAGLTKLTGQVVEEDAMHVYETWLTPPEMISVIKTDSFLRSNRSNLKKPHQLTHFGQAPAFKAIKFQDTVVVNNAIKESVAYDPTAAEHAIKNKLFMATSLLNIYKQSDSLIKNIPPFPSTGITIKPVYKLLKTSTSGLEVFPIASWHGTTDDFTEFPEKDWKSYVYVNTANEGMGNGSQLMVGDNPTPEQIDKATYKLNDFIYYVLNEEDAEAYNKDIDKDEVKAVPGDTVILVAMHVTTREIERWTWQTFWWAPDADNPPLPSSSEIASYRPDALEGAASHYAMSVAYYMVNPTENKYTAPKEQRTNYAFNPYLEAGFGYSVFDDDLSYVETPGEATPTYVGVRTNCMSCHAMATVNPAEFSMMDSSIFSVTPYVGNAYIGLNDSAFKHQLKIDFAWSVQGNIDTTGLANYMKQMKQ